VSRLRLCGTRACASRRRLGLSGQSFPHAVAAARRAGGPMTSIQRRVFDDCAWLTSRGFTQPSATFAHSLVRVLRCTIHIRQLLHVLRRQLRGINRDHQLIDLCGELVPAASRDADGGREGDLYTNAGARGMSSTLVSSGPIWPYKSQGLRTTTTHYGRRHRGTELARTSCHPVLRSTNQLT
jgi:hypothetical protein